MESLLEPDPAYLGCGGYGGRYCLEAVLAMVSWGPRLPRTIIITDKLKPWLTGRLSATSQSREASGWSLPLGRDL